MRVAVWHNLPSGGARRALFNHAKGLLERGHEVEFWSPPIAEKPKFADFAELGPEHVVPLSPLRTDQGGYFRRLYEFTRLVDERIASFEAHARECAEQMRGFDVLFANTDLWFHAPHVGRFFAGPKLLYLQEPNRPLFEMMPEMPWLARPRNAPKRRGLRGLKEWGREAAAVRHARIFAREEIENSKTYDLLLVNSFFSRESVLKCYGRDARVCYLGVDLGLFQNHHGERRRQVVGIGSFGPSKNIELVIRAVGTLPPAERPRVVWVGNLKMGNYAEEMEQLAKDLGVDYAPKFLISDVELVQILNESMLMAYAPRLEPFGFAPIEAGACGLPLVAVAEGGVRETVVNEVNGLLVDHDPEAMGAAILELLNHPEKRQQLADEGERRAHELWSNQAANDRLERHLIQLWQRKHSSPA